MRITSAGNVGIGTTSPDTLLHLRGADTAIIRLENSDDSLIANQIIGGIEFEKTDPNGAGAGVVGGVRMYSQGVVGENTYLTLSTSSSSTNNVERVRINADGRVGIGTTSPGGQVHANSAANKATFLAEGEIDNPSYPSYGWAGQNADNGSRGAGMYLPADGIVAFSTHGNERLRIDNNGRVGIGTSTLDSHQATIEGGIAATAGSSLAVKTGDGANSKRADIAFYGTFVNPTSDQAQRRTADIVSGFSAKVIGEMNFLISVLVIVEELMIVK